jgi:hypothetical protein
MTTNPVEPAEKVPAAGHGKMPKWLFLIWVVLTAWGLYYIARYALPDYRAYTGQPLPTKAERPQ